jgi:hypothetical protein
VDPASLSQMSLVQHPGSVSMRRLVPKEKKGNDATKRPFSAPGGKRVSRKDLNPRKNRRMSEVNQLNLFRESVKKERVKRDVTLDRLEVTRSYLINLGRDLAVKLARLKGVVTSSEVLFLLKHQVPEMLDGIDPRFMGAVFRKGWIKVGYESTGSHGRPVSRWMLKEAA